MQDLRLGNYMAYKLTRTRRGNGRRSFYVIEVRVRRDSYLLPIKIPVLYPVPNCFYIPTFPPTWIGKIRT